MQIIVDELSIKLQNDLYDAMWEYAGVVKNELKLKKGLKIIQDLENRSNDVDVRFEENNCSDLVDLYNLKASLMSAKATLISALQREESRGAHQRSDFCNYDKQNNFSYEIQLSENKLTINKGENYHLKDELYNFVKNTASINDFSNKLLE